MSDGRGLDLSIRRLDADDAAAFRALRLEALRAQPDAFGADLEEERPQPLEWFARRLTTGFVLGGVASSGRLEGIAGVYRPVEAKARHKAHLWGVYVRPERRGAGLATALIRGCIGHARTVAEEIVLGVGTHNAAAIACYRALGFAECGGEQRAIKTGGQYYDEILMAIRFVDQVG